VRKPELPSDRLRRLHGMGPFSACPFCFGPAREPDEQKGRQGVTD
jgi:hypothetical protein